MNTIYPRYQRGFDGNETHQSHSVFVVEHEGGEPKFMGSTVSPEYSKLIVDALNLNGGAPDPIEQLRETLSVLDQVHERLHEIKMHGLPDEIRERATAIVKRAGV